MVYHIQYIYMYAEVQSCRGILCVVEDLFLSAAVSQNLYDLCTTLLCQAVLIDYCKG